jgi:hypothetical protein
MPFFSREFVRLSLEVLNKNYSPLLTVSIPCMLSGRIPTSDSNKAAAKSAKRFGSGEERVWLETYFRPGGGPPDKPYFMGQGWR